MAITSRLRQLSGVRKMLKIEELIPSLNSNYKIERHRNSYGQSFGSYLYGHGYPNSYIGSALLYDELNCYDLIYKENTVLGEIHFVPVKHVEGIHYISLNGYLKSTAKAQLKNAVYSIGRLEDRVTMQKIYQILIPNTNAESNQASKYYLPAIADEPTAMHCPFYDELDLADFIYEYTQNLEAQKQMTIDLLKKYNKEFYDGVQDIKNRMFALREERDHIENRMSELREERDHLCEHLQSKIEKEFLIKSI